MALYVLTKIYQSIEELPAYIFILVTWRWGSMFLQNAGGYLAKYIQVA